MEKVAWLYFIISLVLVFVAPKIIGSIGIVLNAVASKFIFEKAVLMPAIALFAVCFITLFLINGGHWEHSTKSGARDKRYKNNSYDSDFDDDFTSKVNIKLVLCCVASVVLCNMSIS